MTKLKNDTLIRALLRQSTEYTPVWLMRQAGRYLPEYNQTRSRAGSFLDLCKNPGYATEVTLQPLARFELEPPPSCSPTSSPFPTPWAWDCTSPKARGRSSNGRCATSGQSATWLCPTRTRNCATCSTRSAKIRRALAGSVPLIGFAGSPYTLACYMVEGGASDDFRTIKTMLYTRPDLLHRILDINAQAVTHYLNAQIEAGATSGDDLR